MAFGCDSNDSQGSNDENVSSTASENSSVESNTSDEESSVSNNESSDNSEDETSNYETSGEDPDVADPIKFLREREIVHCQRFGDALRIVQDNLDYKNFYAYNPSFDKR